MLGKQLRRKREIIQEPLKEIKERCGLSIMYLSEIEREKKIPRNGCSLKKLSEGYNEPFETVLAWFLEDIRDEGNNE